MDSYTNAAQLRDELTPEDLDDLEDDENPTEPEELEREEW